MSDTPAPVPDFTRWPSFPFEGELRVKALDDPVDVEPARKGEGSRECSACNAPDEAYIWVSERWRVRAMDRPTGLPMVLILESRSHLDLGDLPNLLAAELGVMTVRLERAIRSLDGVARVHVNRWGDGSAHLHLWFLARPHGRLQLRGTFLSLWDAILPPIPEGQWRENLALVAAWLAEFGGRPLAEPPRIQWLAPSSLTQQASAAEASTNGTEPDGAEPDGAEPDGAEPDGTEPDGTGADRAESDGARGVGTASDNPAGPPAAMSTKPPTEETAAEKPTSHEPQAEKAPTENRAGEPVTTGTASRAGVSEAGGDEEDPIEPADPGAPARPIGR
ncbi:hypothetical protein [Polymorphospora lycopeni]|uniref:Diadenosine tetraphosphate (Ap4A) HIT family hydrolase n=1 Tax=Polymorphospora lycopeni TaxID=3140240 RepID=A0ABV5CI02_9ACTN